MLSGRRPRGNRSTPDKGNTGSILGKPAERTENWVDATSRWLAKISVQVR